MNNSPQIDNTVRTAQIIRFALIMGVVIFALVAVFVIKPEPQEIEGDDVRIAMITTLALGFSILTFVLRIIVMSSVKPDVSEERLKAVSEAERSALFLGTWQTRTILEAALWEGAAFFCLIAYILEGYNIPLIFVAALLASMAVTFPTRGRFENYAHQQTERITKQLI